MKKMKKKKFMKITPFYFRFYTCVQIFIGIERIIKIFFAFTVALNVYNTLLHSQVYMSTDIMTERCGVQKHIDLCATHCTHVG